VAATKLKHARIDRDLTLFDLAKLTGISPGRLSMIERALVLARPDERDRLSRVLGVDVLE
jgi:transcriptional regulator with XRE-family HTH domain